jgi:hypothetical protein
VNAVATGLCADIENWISDAGRFAEKDLIVSN